MSEIDWEAELGLNEKIMIRKPTHGSCCTCQTCGYDYDDCYCESNAKIKAYGYIKQLEASICPLQQKLNETKDKVIWKNKYNEASINLQYAEAENTRLKEALEKLARLGNGEHYGNSDGNMIAREALEREVTDE